MAVILVSFCGLAHAKTAKEVMATQYTDCKNAIEKKLAIIPKEGVQMIPDNDKLAISLTKEGRYDTKIQFYQSGNSVRCKYNYRDLVYQGIEKLEIINLFSEDQPDMGGEEEIAVGDDGVPMHFCVNVLTSMLDYPISENSGMTVSLKTVKEIFIEALISEGSVISCTECNKSAPNGEEGELNNSFNESLDESHHEEILSEKAKFETNELPGSSESIILTNQSGKRIGTVGITRLSYFLLEISADVYGHSLVKVFSSNSEHESACKHFASELINAIKDLILPFEKLQDVIINTLSAFRCKVETGKFEDSLGVVSLSLTNKNEKLPTTLPDIDNVEDADDSLDIEEKKIEAQKKSDDEEEKSPNDDNSDQNEEKIDTFRRRKLKTTKETSSQSVKPSHGVFSQGKDKAQRSAAYQPASPFETPRLMFGRKLIDFDNEFGRQLVSVEIDKAECPFKDLQIILNELHVSSFPYIQFSLRVKENFQQPLVLEYFLRRADRNEFERKVRTLMYGFAKNLLTIRKVFSEPASKEIGDQQYTLEELKDAASTFFKSKSLDGSIQWSTEGEIEVCTLKNKQFLQIRKPRPDSEFPKFGISFIAVKLSADMTSTHHELIVSARKADDQLQLFTKQLEDIFKDSSNRLVVV